jgi:glycosyltransferase involved in cell wall biosynthesis
VTKVVFCTPTITRPYQQYLDAMEASVPALNYCGFDHSLVFEIGNPYISAARAAMLRKALDARADVVVFIDHDVSWHPQDLIKLLQTEGDVVAGTYRFKQPVEEYMGTWLTDEQFRPLLNEDLTIKAKCVPAGFLKVTKECVNRFYEAYPELIYGCRYNPSIDLFNHGAYGGLWFGEDYAFCRRWNDCGGSIKLIQDLQIDHHAADQSYPGNLHEFMLRQPGGALSKG